MFHECLPEVTEPCAGVPGDGARNLGVFGELLVHGGRVGRILADDARCAQQDLGACRIDPADDFPQARLVGFAIRALQVVELEGMPNVVDADVDHDVGRVVSQHVTFEACLQIRHLVATDAGADHLDLPVRVTLPQRVFDDADVTAGLRTHFSDRVAKKYDPGRVGG